VDVDAEGLGQELRAAGDAPGLELAVAPGLGPDAQRPRPLRHDEALDDLAVAAVERIGHAQEAGEGADRAPLLLVERAEALVLAPRMPAPVVAGDGGDRLDLAGVEAAEAAVLDQVVAVLVVSGIGDVVADVVEE